MLLLKNVSIDSNVISFKPNFAFQANRNTPGVDPDAMRGDLSIETDS